MPCAILLLQIEKIVHQLCDVSDKNNLKCLFFSFFSFIDNCQTNIFKKIKIVYEISLSVNKKNAIECTLNL